MLLPDRDRNQVKPGDLWGAGPHRFICGDVIQHHQSGLLASLLPAINVVYTDPPWSQSAFTRFQRQANISPTQSIFPFFKNLVNVLKDVCPLGSIGIEMGLTNASRLWALLACAGAKTWGMNQATYGQGRPMEIWLGSFRATGNITIPDGLHGYESLEWAMDLFLPSPGLTYFDPCCGTISFGKVAIQRGAIVHGCELIPGKLAQGLNSLAEMGFEIQCLNDT